MKLLIDGTDEQDSMHIPLFHLHLMELSFLADEISMTTLLKLKRCCLVFLSHAMMTIS